MNNHPTAAGRTRQQHEEGVEPQRSQGDENEHVEECRSFQDERRRLFVLDMKTPDEPHEQGHVDDNGKGQEPPGQGIAVSQKKAYAREGEIGRQCPRYRRDRDVCVEGLGR